MKLGPKGTLNAVVWPHDLRFASLWHCDYGEQLLIFVVAAEADMVLWVPVPGVHDKVKNLLFSDFVDQWDDFKRPSHSQAASVAEVVLHVYND